MQFSPTALLLALAACVLGLPAQLTAAPPAYTSITGPAGSEQYGSQVKALAHGNIVVVDPNYDSPVYGTDVGAVFVYDSSGNLVSMVTGDRQLDRVGSGGVTLLDDGNFVVSSPFWHEMGAVTWVNGQSGLSGDVSSSNSVVGSHAGDSGGLSVTPLANGAYVVRMPYWDNEAIVDAGAVVWSSSAAPVVGAVSAENALIGSSPYDGVGLHGIRVLKSGNYVVTSANWDNGNVQDAGAVTWGNAATGVRGAVSAANSLVGTSGGDAVGGSSGGITELPNGNYLVISYGWDSAGEANAGAITWASGTTGVTGPISAANSLVGSSSTAKVGNRGITVLKNGHYVVRSLREDNTHGAVTWCNGETGTFGEVSAANSLMDAGRTSAPGSDGIVPLTNGSYVVVSSQWTQPLGTVTTPGAVTWCRGDGPTIGNITEANSLIGTQGNITITPLTNGNYVVRCPNVLGGAIVWGSGTSGVVGPVTRANALVNTSTYNYAPGFGLSQNTLLASPAPSSGSTLVVNDTASTSLTLGSTTGASLTRTSGATLTLSGAAIFTGSITIGQPSQIIVGPGMTSLRGGVVALANGNYVVRVPGYGNGLGAVIWGDGTAGVTGEVSAQNALVGHRAGDEVGSGGVVALKNGNYVVLSPGWDATGSLVNAGAITWCQGSAPTVGTVTETNSLVGSASGDAVGGSDQEPARQLLATVFRLPLDPPGYTQRALDNGNFIMLHPNWNSASGGGRGAVTWVDGKAGAAGVISAANALVGTGTDSSITPLTDGNYLVRVPSWSGSGLFNAGAILWADASEPLHGTISSENALVGSRAGDRLGAASLSGLLIIGSPYTPVIYEPTLNVLKDGHYSVSVCYAEGGVAQRGVVFGQGGHGITGEFSAVQSLVFPEASTYSFPDAPVGFSGTNVIIGNYRPASLTQRLFQDHDHHRWIMGAPGAGKVFVQPYEELPLPEITVSQLLTPLRDGGEPVQFTGDGTLGGPNGLVRNITITNDGTAPLTGLMVSKDGLNSADFQVSMVASEPLPPGASVSFDVTFTPRAGGVRTATLHIASNDGDENTFEVNLQGEYTGTLPSGTVAIDAPANATLYARENEGFAFIPLVRTGGVVGNVSVNVTTTAGTATAGADFVNLQDATFTMGDGVSQVNLPIALLNPQGTPEPGEQFVVTISGASVTPGATSSVTVHIQDSAFDSVQPALPTIVSPVANAALNVASGGFITVSGRATDNISVAAVKVWLNGTECTNVSLTTPNGPTTAYSLTVTPTTGANTLMVQSVDASGKFSPAATRTFKVLRPLLVNTDPLRGSVTPGYFPASFREVGSSYAISATARPGFIFTGWTLGGSDVASGGSAFTPQRLGVTESALGLGTLRFTFREGLVLTANFAPNPFARVAGSYNGLIRYYVETGINPPPNSGTLEDVTPSVGDPAPLTDAPPSTPSSSENPMSEKTEGFFKATVLSSGAFTAKVTMEGLTHNLVGTFDSEGVAHFGTGRAAATSVLRAARYNLEISLRLNLAPDRSSDSISGTITQQSVGSSRVLATPLVSTVEAPRIFYNGLTPATTVPAAYLRSGNASGIYTAAMEMTTEPTAYPWGFGYATATLMRTGVMNFIGMLPDGTPWSASAGLSRSNELPLFAQLTKRNLRPGFVIGLVVLDSTMENCDFRSLAGYWQAPKAGSPANSGGLTLPLSSPLEVRTTPVHFMMLGAKYAPLPGQSVLPGLEESTGRQAELAFEGGGIIPSPLVKVVRISPADAVTRVPASDSSFSLVITRNTGIFNGFFTHPGNGAQPKYRGVVLQKGAGAAGFGYFETSSGVGSAVPGSMLAPIITGGVVTLAPQEAVP